MADDGPLVGKIITGKCIIEICSNCPNWAVFEYNKADHLKHDVHPSVRHQWKPTYIIEVDSDSLYAGVPDGVHPRHRVDL